MTRITLILAWFTVGLGATRGKDQRAAHHQPSHFLNTPTTATMTPLEAAIAELNQINSKELISYTKIAKKHGVLRSILI